MHGGVAADSSSFLGDAWSFDTLTNTWTLLVNPNITGAAPYPRAQHCSVGAIGVGGQAGESPSGYSIATVYGCGRKMEDAWHEAGGSIEASPKRRL
jgi:hypothetical protein